MLPGRNVAQVVAVLATLLECMSACGSERCCVNMLRKTPLKSSGNSQLPPRAVQVHASCSSLESAGSRTRAWEIVKRRQSLASESSCHNGGQEGCPRGPGVLNPETSEPQNFGIHKCHHKKSARRPPRRTQSEPHCAKAGTSTSRACLSFKVPVSFHQGDNNTLCDSFMRICARLVLLWRARRRCPRDLHNSGLRRIDLHGLLRHEVAVKRGNNDDVSLHNWQEVRTRECQTSRKKIMGTNCACVKSWGRKLVPEASKWELKVCDGCKLHSAGKVKPRGSSLPHCFEQHSRCSLTAAGQKPW